MFVRCKRCSKEAEAATSEFTGEYGLRPYGWQYILKSDICSDCVEEIKKFIGASERKEG